jgi:hypothetical protein
MATPTNLPATFTVGQTLTAAQVNGLRGAFRILQVVYGATSLSTTNSTSTFISTNLSASITPQSTTSKILVCVFQNGVVKSAGNSQSHIALQVLRSGTNIGQISSTSLYTNSNTELRIGTISAMILDSPATLSAVTYSTQFMNPANAAQIGVQFASDVSTIVLCEVSA